MENSRVKIVQNFNFHGNAPTLLTRDTFFDLRGSFSMLFRQSEIARVTGHDLKFVQVNLIECEPYALRGWHVSPPEDEHWKIVTCIQGKVREAVLDVRSNSPTFGFASYSEMQSPKSVLIIPPGYAHAFQTSENPSKVIYASTVGYENSREISIFPRDPLWPIWDPVGEISERDANASNFLNWTQGLNEIQWPTQ